MPARVVLDHPMSHHTHAVVRGLSSVVGATALLVGLLVSLIAIPTTLLVVGFIVANFADQAETEAWPPPGFPVLEVVLAWAVSSVLSLGGLRLGLHLIRGRRTTVLFLRRFGYSKASQAVTYAAATTIGSSWRLVTLDDEDIAPLGVNEPPRRAFGIVAVVSRTAAKVMQFLSFRVFPTAVTLVWVPVGLEFLRAGDWRAVLTDGTIDPYVEIYGMLMELRPPIEYFEASLPGMFAIVGTVAALSFLGLLGTFIALLLALPFAGIIGFVSSAVGAVDAAERSKTLAVRNHADLHQVVATITERSRRVLAPRLVVLRVAHDIWQETVTRLATVTAVSIIDVSEVTENLAWELSELERLFGDHYVIIGEYGQVLRWEQPPLEVPAANSLEFRLREWFEGREIVAYTADAAGRRRFARTLRSVLLSLDSARDPSPDSINRAAE